MKHTDGYIWTDSCFSAGDGMPFIGGETDRNGTYILNFFKCQPALNYGYGKCREKRQMPTDAPGPRATVEAVKDVMRFWLDMGCDGFRVDMASSLVKNDTHHKKVYLCHLSRYCRYAGQGIPRSRSGQHRTIPALRLKHRSGSCGTASALPKCSIRHPVLSALLAWHLPHLARRIGT